MKSLLYQEDGSNHTVPPGCGLCDRNEVKISLRKGNKIYRFVVRDKVTVDDIYVIGIKAAAFAIQQNQPHPGTPTDRAVKNSLIKTDLVI